jgi:hypothetical protein
MQEELQPSEVEKEQWTEQVRCARNEEMHYEIDDGIMNTARVKQEEARSRGKMAHLHCLYSC